MCTLIKLCSVLIFLVVLVSSYFRGRQTITGQTLFSKDIEKTGDEIVIPIEMESVRAGVYFIEVAGASFRQNLKVVVE